MYHLVLHPKKQTFRLYLYKKNPDPPGGSPPYCTTTARYNTMRYSALSDWFLNRFIFLFVPA